VGGGHILKAVTRTTEAITVLGPKQLFGSKKKREYKRKSKRVKEGPWGATTGWKKNKTSHGSGINKMQKFPTQGPGVPIIPTED